MGDKQILYFVKYPEAGKVKTRLARDMGTEEAARLYKKAAEKNLAVLAEVEEPFGLTVVYDPPEKEAGIKVWLKPFQIEDFLPQRGAGLGERLEHAFRFAFQRRPKELPVRCVSPVLNAPGLQKRRKTGRFAAVMALGSDTLALTPQIVTEGFEALEAFDCVIGPAKDGGYYLIGLNFEDAGIFRNIPWSTHEVYQSTVQYVEREELSYYRLPMLEDLDEIKNLMSAQLTERSEGKLPRESIPASFKRGSISRFPSRE